VVWATHGAGPAVPGLHFQAVRSDDAGEAYRVAVMSNCIGAFNVAAEPVIGPEELAGMAPVTPGSAAGSRDRHGVAPRRTGV
jgi:hypothetical protein